MTDRIPAASEADAAIPVLVGRERERAHLRQALAATLDGRGRVVLVSGEAGIGKTTLVGDLSAWAEGAGALVLWGHSYDLSVTPPYAPWLEILRLYERRAPHLPPVPAFVSDAAELDKVGSQDALFAAVVAFFGAVAAERPLVLVLDDLHWADQPSLDFLRVLARQVAEHRLLLVATYRSDELTRRHPLSSLLPLLVREAGAERLEVRPLTEPGLRALIRRRYALAPSDEGRLERYLEERAEGNPLYAGELLRTLEGEGVLRQQEGAWTLSDLELIRVPLLLRQVIGARIGRLDEESQWLLGVAAVIGQTVPLAIWTRVSAAEEDRLLELAERAEEAWLLAGTPQGETVQFSHALIREVLYEGIPALRRGRLHRHVGEALAEQIAPEPDTVASHLQAAGDPCAVEWLLKAGERAKRAYAWTTAVARFESALTSLTEQGAPASQRAVLLFRIAHLGRYVNPSHSATQLDEARRLAIEAGEPALAACCLYVSGLPRFWLGDVARALAAMGQGDADYHALTQSEQARLWPLLGMDTDAFSGSLITNLAYAGRFEEVSRHGKRQITDMPAPPLRAGQGMSAYADGLVGLAIAAAFRGHPGEASRLFQQARAMYQVVEHYYMLAETCQLELELVHMTYFPDDQEARRGLITQADEVARRASSATGDVPPRGHVLGHLMLVGAWQEARKLATEMAEHPVWHSRNHGARWLAPLAYGQGDTVLAWRVIGEVVPGGPETEPGTTYFSTTMPLQRLAVELSLDAHDLPTARAWLDEHDRWLRWSGAALGQADGALLRGRYVRAAGDTIRARQHAGQALVYASDPRQPLALIAAHRFLGHLDREDGHAGAADAHLAAALSLADACAARIERALTLLELAELRIAQRRTDEASDLLAEARTICERLAASPTLQRVAELEARLGAMPAASYPAGLSAREVEVLRLVANGMTDAEVAGQLFISPRTVGQHLRSIYNKLGVNSRTAATRFAVERGLT